MSTYDKPSKFRIVVPPDEQNKNYGGILSVAVVPPSWIRRLLINKIARGVFRLELTKPGERE